MNEWEFTGDVQSRMNIILERDRSLAFSWVKIEKWTDGSWKRADLTLLDKNKQAVLSGEVKLPFRPDGGSPYNERLVQDARLKAARLGASFFFTWNVNECVLWETFAEDLGHEERKYRSWSVTRAYKESHLQQAATEHAIQQWLEVFLREVSDIVRGHIRLGTRPPDEKFVELLESALQMPINFSYDELAGRYTQPRFRSRLDQWMRERQGWTIVDDEEGIRENLERAAKFSCYALVNKLVFHEALLKRYSAQIDRLSIPEYVDEGEKLRTHVEHYFAKAKDATRDYETVFGEDHREIGNQIPFYSDQAVPHWRELINQIHVFDFSRLDYEIIGNIFERLISPEERHKYGQYYTRPEVVDLINSFCILTGTEKLMDPACGGGTFLVRAYARKRELAPAKEHGQILRDIFGVDLSHFASHLTTINLTTRDLIDEENYPQIVRSDFFEVRPDKPFLLLPGPRGKRQVTVPPLDAVVGNPPYVRQERIPKHKNGDKPPRKGTKDYYLQLVESEWPDLRLSGRSDLHCYFWPHAAKFLKDDGLLCLLTSSQWLDVEYGFRLQEWMLNHFEILAVLESAVEPWFVGARVATTVTILRLQPDEAARMGNTVRFVQIRRPLAEILAHDGTTAGAVDAANAFRDEILNLTANTVNSRYRARLVKQADLWREGVELGEMMGQPQEYYGGKWGIQLRAPDLWFEILDECQGHLVPLSSVADVRRGITSGKDSFFFPKDISASALTSHKDPMEFEAEYGAPHNLVASGAISIVICGEGRNSVRAIEKKYLEPEVHSLMEIRGYTVAPADCSRQILLVAEPKERIEGTYALDYINWGEKENYHTGTTCAARKSGLRAWYDLTGQVRGALFWPMAQQYRHVIPVNDSNLICNHNLFCLNPQAVDTTVLAGTLNSSWVVLAKNCYGRPVGVEGNLKTEVVDVNIMKVPDPREAGGRRLSRVKHAFNALKGRPALQFLSERRLRQMAYLQAGKADQLQELSDLCELDMPDRRELDDAVLEMMGVASPERRADLIDRLYDHLKAHFEQVRQKEELAIANKKKAKRRGPARPGEIAAQVLTQIKQDEPQLLRSYEKHFLDPSAAFEVIELPESGTAELHSDMFAEHAVRFVQGKKKLGTIEASSASQAELLAVLANDGWRGLVPVPRNDSECARVLADYRQFAAHRDERLWELVAERTADEDTQEKVMSTLLNLVRAAR